jgi:hypothetical protein
MMTEGPELRILYADSRGAVFDARGERYDVVPATEEDVIPITRIFYDRYRIVVFPENIPTEEGLVLRKPPEGKGEPTEKQKQDAAYYDWLARGRPIGDDQTDYYAAEKELRKGVVIGASLNQKENTEEASELTVVSPYAGATRLFHAMLESTQETRKRFKRCSYLNERTTTNQC